MQKSLQLCEKKWFKVIHRKDLIYDWTEFLDSVYKKLTTTKSTKFAIQQYVQLKYRLDGVYSSYSPPVFTLFNFKRNPFPQNTSLECRFMNPVLVGFMWKWVMLGGGPYSSLWPIMSSLAAVRMEWLNFFRNLLNNQFHSLHHQLLGRENYG